MVNNGFFQDLGQNGQIMQTMTISGREMGQQQQHQWGETEAANKILCGSFGTLSAGLRIAWSDG